MRSRIVLKRISDILGHKACLKGNVMRALFFLYIISISMPGICFAQEWLQAQAAIHVSSRCSDGKYSIAEIVSIAEQNDRKVIIITDRDSMRWEYGLWPLRRLIKKRTEENSVFRYGIERYLKTIEKAQNENPDMVVLPGLESAPYYYWSGNFFENTLTLNNWHKHLVVIGLDESKDIARLPVTGNIRGLALPFRFKDLLSLLLPFFFLAAGSVFLLRRTFDYRDNYGRQLGMCSPEAQLKGVLSIIAGLALLYNAYPFRGILFTQYQNKGIMPYQHFIDYVSRRAGMTFWAHPEAANMEQIGPVKVETTAHSEDLLQTDGYTGFTVFYEGYNKIGVAGGIWDETLLQYCRGIRLKPVWAIAGLAFDTGKDLPARMKMVKTVLLLSKLDKASVLDSIARGRMYAVEGEGASSFSLDSFIVRDGVSGATKTMGEEITVGVSRVPRIEMSGSFADKRQATMSIQLIKNGRVLRVFESPTPFHFVFDDEDPSFARKSYYRLDAQGQSVHVITNPIFVKRQIQ